MDGELTAIRAGQVSIRGGSILGKSWHKKFCILYGKTIKFPPFLDLVDEKDKDTYYDQRSSKKKLHYDKRIVLEGVKRLDKYIKSGRNSEYSLEIKTKRDKYSLAFETENDLILWDNLLRSTIDFCEGDDNSSTLQSEDGDEVNVANEMYEKTDQDPTFEVEVLVNTDAAKRCQLKGNYKYLLRIGLSDISLVEPSSKCSVYSWMFAHIRRFGLQVKQQIFLIEAGRKCGSGEGLFHFMTEQCQVIHKLVQLNAKRQVPGGGGAAVVNIPTQDSTNMNEPQQKLRTSVGKVSSEQSDNRPPSTANITATPPTPTKKIHQSSSEKYNKSHSKDEQAGKRSQSEHLETENRFVPDENFKKDLENRLHDLHPQEEVEHDHSGHIDRKDRGKKGSKGKDKSSKEGKHGIFSFARRDKDSKHEKGKEEEKAKPPSRPASRPEVQNPPMTVADLNIYDEPEVRSAKSSSPPVQVPPGEFLYDEVQQPQKNNTKKDKKPAPVVDPNATYSEPVKRSDNMWQSYGRDTDQHEENYSSIKNARKEMEEENLAGEYIQQKNSFDDEEDDTYDKLNLKSKVPRKPVKSEGIYGQASGKVGTLPEDLYETVEDDNEYTDTATAASAAEYAEYEETETRQPVKPKPQPKRKPQPLYEEVA